MKAKKEKIPVLNEENNKVLIGDPNELIKIEDNDDENPDKDPDDWQDPESEETEPEPTEPEIEYDEED